jgi:Kdo2-lipid IVA lauroyltransferase/acyltransferase
MKTIPHTPAEARRSHLESVFWRKTLLWGLQHVPVPLQELSMPLWSAFFYLQVPHVRRAIDQNLARLLGRPTPRRMTFRTFSNYCHCIANGYRVHAGYGRPLPAEVEGLNILQELLSSGRGAILATGHLGNWHLGPYLLAQQKLPQITVVMHEEPNRETQRIEVALRDRRMRVLYPHPSPLLSLELRGALDRGELVGIQMDRPGSNGGVVVPCAGGWATFDLGPAALSRACGVPVVPVFFPLIAEGVRVEIHPPLWANRTADRKDDLRELTARLAEIYGRVIRRYPDQWFNFYDFWGKGSGA